MKAVRRVLRGVILLVAILIVAVIVSIAVNAPRARIYSVEDVRSLLQSDRKHWIGRTLLVQGWMVSYAFSCSRASYTRSHRTPPPGCYTGSWEEIGPTDGDLLMQGLPITPTRLPVSATGDSLLRPIAIALYRAPFLGHMLFGMPSTAGGSDVYEVKVLSHHGCTTSPSAPPCPDVAIIRSLP